RQVQCGLQRHILDADGDLRVRADAVFFDGLLVEDDVDALPVAQVVEQAVQRSILAVERDGQLEPVLQRQLLVRGDAGLNDPAGDGFVGYVRSLVSEPEAPPLRLHLAQVILRTLRYVGIGLVGAGRTGAGIEEGVHAARAQVPERPKDFARTGRI